MSEDDAPQTEEDLDDTESAEDSAAEQDDTQGDEDAEELEDLETRVSDLEQREQQLHAEDVFDKVFPATVATDGTFTELVSLSGTLATFIDGRTGSVIALGAGQSMVVEVVDPGSGSNPPSMKFIQISGGGGLFASFEVLEKANGVDGDGNPKYDLYALSDTGMTTKLNLAGALAPLNSRARLASGVTPIAPGDGGYAAAFYDLAGAIQLWDLPETLCSNTITVTSGNV